VNRRNGTIASVRKIAKVYRSKQHVQSVILHRRLLGGLSIPNQLVIWLLCPSGNRRWVCPPELTILLLHNYSSPPLMEQSLRRGGIFNFTVLNPSGSGPWRNSTKISTILRFLEERCRTEYVLYADSNDAILIDDPRRALDCLADQGCDVLFSSTRFSGAYEYMPKTKAWADDICRTAGYENLYLNAGVFVGRTSVLRELLHTASAYVTPEDLSREEYIRRRRDGTLGEVIPAFPKGVGCDQVILRYVQPSFHPSVKIDYASRLAVR
jgi:hypothetical protein